MKGNLIMKKNFFATVLIFLVALVLVGQLFVFDTLQDALFVDFIEETDHFFYIALSIIWQ